MERVVSDASVVVKWFIQEGYSGKASKLRDMHVNEEFYIIVQSYVRDRKSTKGYLKTIQE